MFDRELFMGKVLIVDDEPSMRRILSSNLRLDSHVVVEADSASAAIIHLTREDFDVVITDQKMPGGSGMEIGRASCRERV